MTTPRRVGLDGSPDKLTRSATLGAEVVRLQTIVAIQQEVAASSASVLDLMTLVAHRAQSLTGASGAAIELPDGADLVYCAGAGSAEFHVGTRVPRAGSLSGTAFQDAEVLKCEDSRTDIRVNGQLCDRMGIRSMVVAPLLWSQRTIGVLKVVSSHPKAFDDQDVQTLRLVAGIIASRLALASELHDRQQLLEANAVTLAALRESETRLSSSFGALRESERLYRTLARHLPSSVVLMYDRNLRSLIADGSGLAAAGLTPDQIEGRPVAEHATPSLLQDYRAVFDGRSTDTEIEREGGRTYRVQLIPVRDDDEHIFAGLMLGEDLTEQRGREELQRRDAHLKLLAETIPQIVWTANPDGFLDYYNQRWFDYTGMNLEQTQGWGWKPVVHPNDVQTCVDRWTEAVRTGDAYEVEYRFKRASDGAYRWHLGRASPLKDAAGRIQKWFGTCTDIDDQRKAQDTLRQAQEILEARVEQRTAELVQANAALVRESERRVLSEERFRAAVDSMLDSFYIMESVRDAQGMVVDYRFVEANTAGLEATRRTRENLVGTLHSKLMIGSDYAARRDSYTKVLESNVATEREVRIEMPGGTALWIRQQTIPFRDGVVLSVREITEAKEIEAQLMLSRAQAQDQLLILEGVLQSAAEGIVVADQKGAFLFFNQAAEHILGLGATGTQTEWSNSYGVFHPDGTTPFPAEELPLSGAIRGQASDYVPLFIRNHNVPHGVFISVTGRPLRGSDGTARGGVVTFRDITELKKAQEKLLWLARTDEMTGIPNYRAFRERLSQLVAEGNRGRRFALVMADVDHFKKLNDTYGHPMGDKVLQAVADVLKRSVRKTDFVARYGGEEFCVLFTDVDGDMVQTLAEKLRHAVETLPLPTPVTATFGVADFSADASGDDEDLIKAADQALYQGKHQGRNRVVRARPGRD